MKNDQEDAGATAREPQILQEPEPQGAAGSVEADEIDTSVWSRGLWMLVLAFLFGVGEFILLVAAVLQFFWMLFGKAKNEPIASFGKDLAAWLSDVAKFQTGASEQKPFPFQAWGNEP